MEAGSKIIALPARQVKEGKDEKMAFIELQEKKENNKKRRTN